MKTAFEILSEEAKKEFWAALAFRYCAHLPQRTFKRLLIHFGSAFSAFSYLTKKQETLEHNLKKNFQIPKALVDTLRQEKWRELALKEWQEAKLFYGEIILWTDYRYPLELKQIADPPAFLYCKGDISLLNSPSLAIVGSRKFHSETEKKTRLIAEELSQHGICIISGLAKGIDFAAHSGALKGISKTIAVLGCGADIIYPIEHEALYEEILKHGLIISEFSPKSKPFPQNFPIRNRIVSGLSAGVLVAEAAIRSGSLITARLALEQNRPVYVLKPQSEKHSLGCHALIEDGACQIEDALSIIADIAPYLQDKVDYSTHTRDLEITEFITKENHVSLEPQKDVEKKSLPLQNISKVPEKELATAKTIYDGFPNEFLTRTLISPEGVYRLDIDYKSLVEKIMGDSDPVDTKEILTSRHKKKQNTQKSKKEKNTTVDAIKVVDQSVLDSPKSETVTKKDRTCLGEFEKKILEILDEKSPLVPDEILMLLPQEFQNISNLSMTLLMLEVDAFVLRLSGNRYDLVKSKAF